MWQARGRVMCGHEKYYPCPRRSFTLSFLNTRYFVILRFHACLAQHLTSCPNAGGRCLFRFADSDHSATFPAVAPCTHSPRTHNRATYCVPCSLPPPAPSPFPPRPAPLQLTSTFVVSNSVVVHGLSIQSPPVSSSARQVIPPPQALAVTTSSSFDSLTCPPLAPATSNSLTLLFPQESCCLRNVLSLVRANGRATRS